jgi:C-terminal processing protease CtpA/Prc
MFLTQIKDNGLATIVGEETGEPGCHSGEMSMFTLPNSRLRASFSSKDWIRPAGCRDQSGAVPDVPVRRTVTDYIMGRDTALETALNLIKRANNQPMNP